MFRIYRYVAVTSAMVVLAAMFLIGFFYHHNAVNDLVIIAENQNVAMAKTLSRSILTRFTNYIVSLEISDSDELSERAETKELDQVLRILTDGLDVIKVKIYNLDGLTVYSSEAAQIGELRQDDPKSSAFAVAAMQGIPQSKLSFRESFSAFSGEVFERDVVETYVPLKNKTEQIGVFELYTDVTKVKDRIDRSVATMICILLGIFLLLYGALILVIMRRAIAPLQLASSQASAIGPQSPGVRLPTDSVPREVLPLIQAVNGALDRLDQALSAQRRFTADAAHELLTPLAVLTANLDTLQNQEIAGALRQDVDAMSDIVTQLLELAELESAEWQADVSADAHEVCTEVLSAIAPLAYQQGKELALTGTDRAIDLHCCPKALSRAVGNLVKNAIRHAPENTMVELNLQEDGAIRVLDQGPGIPPSEQKKIFERFWRGKDKNKPGAGLGLSIVKRIAELNGGTIEVENAEGGGAIFTLRLPRAGASGA